MKLFILTLTMFFFAGCGSVSVDSKREALLMPEPIAKRVLEKHLGVAWVKRPRGRYIQGFGQFCGDQGYGDLPFSEINVVRSFPDLNVLAITKTNWLTAGIPCTQLSHEVNGYFSPEDVKDIIDALVSLGAKIEQRR